MNKLLVKKILEDPLRYGWSTQGLGMLRLYLDPDTRLHVWSPSMRVDNVSDIHDHPWHFTSTIIAGQLSQSRLTETISEMDAMYYRTRIQCGEGACVVAEPVAVRLHRHPMETYGEGESYHMRAHEIHQSHPSPGTVSIIQRTPLDDPDHANIYHKGPWVDAEPRPATNEEVVSAAAMALGTWF